MKESERKNFQKENTAIQFAACEPHEKRHWTERRHHQRSVEFKATFFYTMYTKHYKFQKKTMNKFSTL